MAKSGIIRRMSGFGDESPPPNPLISKRSMGILPMICCCYCSFYDARTTTTTAKTWPRWPWYSCPYGHATTLVRRLTPEHGKNSMNMAKKHAKRESGIDNLLQIRHLSFRAARKPGSSGFRTRSGGFLTRRGGFQSRSGGLPTGSNRFQSHLWGRQDPWFG